MVNVDFEHYFTQSISLTEKLAKHIKECFGGGGDSVASGQEFFMT